MKYAICLFALSATLIGVATPVVAQCLTTTTSSGGLWNDRGTWDNGVPDSTKLAVIPAGVTCFFPDSQQGFDGAACSLEVSGMLILSNAISPGVNTLTVGANSKIDGTFEIDVRTEFHISSDVTVDGVGDIILSGGGDVFFTDGGSHTLTLENDCTGALDDSCGVSLHGFGKISIPLTNNSLVIADACVFAADLPVGWLGSLDVAGSPTNGSGIWRVDVGILGIATSVTGSGTWQLWSECVSTPGLIIGSPCTGLTGNLEVGTPHPQEVTADIELRADFCTTGNLNWFPLSSSSKVTAKMNQRFRVGVPSCSGL